MKIIAFEGLDKAGKATLSRHLADYLEMKGYTVGHMDFHRYSTPTGQLIRKFLYGEYKVPQEAIELIMAADKIAANPDFKMLEEEGYDFLILDRYKLSQYVYSQANGINEELATLLWNLVPDPDETIYIDISPETSMARQGKHGDNDKYESNYELLARVRAEYMEYAHQKLPVILDGEDDIEQVKARLLIEMAHRLEIPTCP